MPSVNKKITKKRKGDLELALDTLLPPSLEKNSGQLREIFDARKKKINQSSRLPNTDYSNFLGKYQLTGTKKLPGDE